MLSEYAFETGMSFGKEVIPNLDSITKDETKRYWREKVIQLETDEIKSKQLNNIDLYQSGIDKAVKGETFLRLRKKEYQLIEDELNDIIKGVKEKIIQRVDYSNLITYDQMISKLHEKKDDKELKNIITQRFKAVFIDEFQDTDKLQYEIFKSFFHSDSDQKTILFYIGDPKQSIYSFRNADPDTYLLARREVGENTWTMGTNYRSNQSLIDKFNIFFQKCENFHPFAHVKTNEEEQIQYQDIDSEDNVNSTNFDNPFCIHETEDSSIKAIAEYTQELLNSDRKINDIYIKPKDIAIILRTNRECRLMKKKLERKGIPAIVSDDSSIFKTDEARSILYLFRAVLETTESNINAFLMEPMLYLTTEDVKNLDYKEVVPMFKIWGKIWNESGLPSMIFDMRIRTGILKKWKNNVTTGHRILSNIQQITEIIQQKSSHEHLTPSDQLRFIHMKINEEEVNSEYEVRIESDEEAVQIMTIHKSKGLEFPIVLTGCLELSEIPEKHLKYYSIRHDNNRCFLLRHNQSERVYPDQNYRNIFNRQTHEENKRLIYVAITRAKYHFSLFVNTEKFNGTTIEGYINALKTKKAYDSFVKKEDLTRRQNTSQENTQNDLISDGREYPKLILPDHNYKKISYSFLSAGHSSALPESTATYDESSYEHFIFNILPKGSRTGDLLHSIFEYIDFDNDETHSDIIGKAFSKHLPAEKDNKEWQKNILELIVKVLNAQLLDNGFSLKQVNRSKRINEFEFHFTMPDEFAINNLENLFDEKDSRKIHAGYGTVKGMMTGFIDMFIEHNGKYYLLDWKSNFLGDDYASYDSDKLEEAMNKNNYHLQYLIYTLAIDTFLKSRSAEYSYDKDFGGVFYLFLRGIQDSGTSGIYYRKPEYSEVEKLRQIFNLNADSQPLLAQ